MDHQNTTKTEPDAIIVSVNEPGPFNEPVNEPGPFLGARRELSICNACRYCEGFCPVFPALTRSPELADQDLRYVANLCHNCTACFHACQYKPPHPFDINIPRQLAQLRLEDYAAYARPRRLAQAFEHNAAVTTLVILGTLLLAVAGAGLLLEQSRLFGVHTGPGAFYAVVSHGVIVLLAGTTLGLSVVSMAISVRTWWQDNGGVGADNPLSLDVWRSAMLAALTVRHLDAGQGQGCNTTDDQFSHSRRLFHQCTMWGFLLCFAATCTATVYELLLNWPSPFALTSAPVLLGTIGGLGLLLGPAGLLWLKTRSHPEPFHLQMMRIDQVFLMLLILISATGFALLLARETAGMGTLLIVHLALVLSFFVLLPYSKFVHAPYRVAALLRYYRDLNGQ